MTKKQMWAIQNLKRMAKSEMMTGREEFKEFKIDEYEHFVSLSMVIGLKDDEGTLAEVYGRDRALFFIGKRGAIRYPVDTKRGFTERPFRSVLDTVIEQRVK